MRVHILSPCGELIDVSPAMSLDYVKRGVFDDEGCIFNESVEFDDYRDQTQREIIATCFHLTHCPNCKADHSEPLRDMIKKCFMLWNTDVKVLQDLDKNYETKDGFVRIKLHGVEVGWQERRYN